MKKVPFAQAQFITSALLEEQCPTLKTEHGTILPEIAIIGKSNVGKSSLINHLLKNKHLAKVSATPGKTQTINFFLIDKQLCLVDLPGYGFAKVAGDLKKKWAKSIDHYLNTREPLKLLLFLLDSRRTPTEEDSLLIRWASHRELPMLIIFTKTDKVNDSQKRANTLASLEILKQDLGEIPIPFLHYSIKNSHSRTELIDAIHTTLATTHPSV